MSNAVTIRAATSADVGLILGFIKELAEYERLAHMITATEERLQESLFGPRPYAEVLLAELEGVAVGFALFFHNYSTFLAQPGIYLEDLYVQPQARGQGIGRTLLTALARLARERGCGRLEWAVLDWNSDAIAFYQRLGGQLLDDWRIFRLAGAALVELAAS
jgi:GNAT superfamily N-acetyltransferase